MRVLLPLAALVVPLLVPLGASQAQAGAPADAAANAPLPTAGAADGIQSLALRPLSDTTHPGGGAAPGEGSQAQLQGLPVTPTEPFSLLGVVWSDPGAALDGRVEVRTRDAGTGEWSGWQELEAGGEHAPDPGAAEAGDGTVRGGTAPLWVGASDAVQVRVAVGGESPDGLRVELIDPMTVTPSSDEATEATEATDEVEEEAGEEAGEDAVALPAGAEFVGPRPPIVTRSGWGADESLRESGFVYTDWVRTAFIHHTAGSNDYACKNADSVIRGIYSYHVVSLGWRDVGYNFFVDRCGTIYEGRAGGVTEPVQGAHTYGHNHNSMGVAVLGSYEDTKPSKRALEGLAKLTAWKLGLFGVNPTKSQVRISGGGKYAAGTEVRLNNISGHRDGYATACPGERLYDELSTVRSTAARLQGR
ncbi:peptidoglycan recognition protein family protein [Streptomyces sp. 6N223]|uniref:peptidoglycan recognition protein family protein n=1 Tax=Streptomyces sp. 6N223 TaxID=3457412 RepID=UPI003FD48549